MIEFKLKPTFATVDSCFDLVGSRQYGVASYMKYSAGQLKVAGHAEKMRNSPVHFFSFHTHPRLRSLAVFKQFEGDRKAGKPRAPKP